METSLLSTKLVIPPPRPVLVTRLRLLERLQEGLGYSLLLISAPAGFGKTTLLSEWAQQITQRTRTARLSLDEGDNDPVRFWDYFIASLQTLLLECGEKILQWLHSSEPPSTEPILNAIINELSHMKVHLFIVLDDYHIIKTLQIHEGVTYLIEHMPAHVHLVIASRADPPLPLARFRGKGMMLEIHTDDLRFTHDDTASLLRELKTQGLSDSDITALNKRTEGWVVGLKMAALSMKGLKDVPGFIATFSGSQLYIMDYLLEEVLQKQSQDIRDFLMKTSILERLNGSSCDAITGRKDSQKVLLNLELDHLFIVPLDESRQWYRYEYLFGDLLQRECETTYGAGQVVTLHQHASQWCEDNALPDEAINHALAARDWRKAIRLISNRYEEHRKLGQFETLISWLKAIPEETLRGYLHLYSKYPSILCATGRLDMAETALKFLETVNLNDTSKGDVTFAQGFISKSRGNLKYSIELFEKAFTLLPPDDISMRSRIAANIAHSQQRLGHFREVEKWATTAIELGQQTGDIIAVETAMSQLGIVNSYQGKLKHAIEIYKKTNERGVKTAFTGNQGMLCINQYYLNDLESVVENAQLTIEM
ncbi:MAG: hypothetical protein JSU58_03515, partial [Dehalococcoidales bacterium]